MTSFVDYMAQLATAVSEEPVEPCIEHGEKQFKQRLENARLASGAVTKIVEQEGESTSKPVSGDLVKFHYTITRDGQYLVSSRAVLGGSGTPVVAVLEKGCRLPRGLEIGIMSMTKSERCSFTVKESFGFGHALCQWRLADEEDEKGTLDFAIELLDFHPAAGTSVVRGETFKGMVLKHSIKEGMGWENPRPPYEVDLTLEARDAREPDGPPFYAAGVGGPKRLTMGASALPAALEEAVNLMFKGETCLVYCPVSELGREWAEKYGTPAEVEMVLFEVNVADVIQVRDVVGTGEVMKMRMTDGTGQFPIDCPIEDCRVRIHCIGRTKDGQVFWDTHSGDGSPFEFDTGTGVVPEGLEMCIKLMVPEETSLVRCKPAFAYDEADVASGPAVMLDVAGQEVEWEVTLLSFDKPKLGSTSQEELMLADFLDEVGKAKDQGNSLYRKGKFDLAKAKYTKLMKQIDAVRLAEAGGEGEEEEQEMFRVVGELRMGVRLNLAACAHQLGDFREAIAECNRALEVNPTSGKAFYRRGKAWASLGEWASARADFTEMGKADPSASEDAAKLLKNVTKMERAKLRAEKEQFHGFLSR